MPSLLERPTTSVDQPQQRVPTPARRIGYLVAAAANGVLLWGAHQLLDWGWPTFLTSEFTAVLGIVTASFVASILANLALAIHHGPRFKALTDLVTAAFAMAVGLRMWEVFPFDFSGYATDWTPWVHIALIAGIAATGIAMVANFARLLTGDDA